MLYEYRIDLLNELFNMEYQRYMDTNEDGSLSTEISIPGALKENVSIKLSKRPADAKRYLVVDFKGNKHVSKFRYNYIVFDETKDKDVDAKLESGILYINVKPPKEYEQSIEIR